MAESVLRVTERILQEASSSRQVLVRTRSREVRGGGGGGMMGVLQEASRCWYRPGVWRGAAGG